MEDEIMKKLKLKIAISEIKKESDIAMNRKRKFVNPKIGIAACACLVLTTGVVFGKDIEHYIKKIFNNSTEAIDIAVENGYIQNENMDYIYDKDIGIRVDNLVLDELNLDISFNFETKKENVKSVRLNDFIITNDNDKVVYRSEFKSVETPEELPLYNSVNWSNQPIKLTDNTFKDSILFGLRPEREDFKELYFDINSLQVTYNDDTREIIDGNWKFDITINDEMRKSQNTIYTMAEDNEYVESCKGTMSPTGLIVELNLKEPIDQMKYIQENFERIDGIGLFYLKSNNELIAPLLIENGSDNSIYILHYDNSGMFYNDVDEIEIYIEPYNFLIKLIQDS